MNKKELLKIVDRVKFYEEKRKKLKIKPSEYYTEGDLKCYIDIILEAGKLLEKEK